MSKVDIKTIKTKEQQLQEIIKCKNSFVYFLENYCFFNVGIGFRRLDLAQKQRELAETIVKDHNILILGSRQTGKTTILIAYCAWVLLFFPAMSITFISRKEEQAKEQLTDIANLFERLPEFLRPTLKPNQATIKRVQETDSVIKIESVLSDPSSKGRGIRSHIIWVDEAAFIPTLNELLVGLLPTTAQRFQMAKKANLPYGVIMTTTPNGIVGAGKTFYDLWQQAETAKENPDEYSFFKSFKIHWSDIPFYNKEWYENEKKKLGKDRIREFHQEYDLLFIGAQNSFLSDEMIANLSYSDPIEKDGLLSIYERYNENEKYIIAIDPATEYGSANTAVCVLAASDGRQVAEYVNKLPIYSLTREDLLTVLKKVIKHYPNGLIVFENNGIGNQLVEQLPTIEELKDHIYKPKGKKYGIHSNHATRKTYFNLIYSYVLDHPDHIKGYNTVKEIIALAIDKDGRIGKTKGNTDDAAIAFGIGLYSRILLKKEWNLNVSDTDDEQTIEAANNIFNMNKKQENPLEFQATLKNDGTLANNVRVETYSLGYNAELLKKYADLFKNLS